MKSNISFVVGLLWCFVASMALAQQAEVPPGSTFGVVSGNGQSLPTGSPSAPLVGVLRDPEGQPVAGALVRFEASPAGTASFSKPDAITDAQGQVSVVVTPGLPITISIRMVAAQQPDVIATFAITGGVAFIDGLSPGIRSLAAVIDVACPTLATSPPGSLDAAQQDLLQRCTEMVVSATSASGNVVDALNAVLPDEALPQGTAAVAGRDIQLRNVDLRLDTLRGGAQGMSIAGLSFVTSQGQLSLDPLMGLISRANAGDADTVDSRWGFFFTGLIGRIDKADRVESPGFDNDTWGVTAGIDYRFSNQFVAGVGVGYNRADVDISNDAGTIESDQQVLNIYGSWNFDNQFYFDALASFGRIEYDQRRAIRYTIPGLDAGSVTQINQLALSDPDGDSSTLALTLGRNWSFDSWTVGAHARGEWSQLDLDGYQERAGNPSAPGTGLMTRVDARDLRSRTLTVGGRASNAISRNWGVLIPGMRLDWVREFQEDAVGVNARLVSDPTNTRFSITGENIDQDYGHLGLSLAAMLPGGRSLFASYEHRFGQRDIDRNVFSFGGRIEF